MPTNRAVTVYSNKSIGVSPNMNGGGVSTASRALKPDLYEISSGSENNGNWFVVCGVRKDLTNIASTDTFTVTLAAKNMFGPK